MPSTPRIAVLGGPVPPGLRAELADNLHLVPFEEVGDEPLAAILIHATSAAAEAVARFREAGGTTPIFALTEGRLLVTDRLAWIRQGAEDVLPLDRAAEALVTRFRGARARASQASPTDLGVRLDRYLLTMDQYLAHRDDVLRRLGELPGQRYLDLLLLRQHVQHAATNEDRPLAPGERRSAFRESLRWPVRIAELPESPAELTDVGPDGLGLLLGVDPRGRTTLGLAVEGYAVSAEIDVEVRWRRRAPGGVEVGTWIHHLRVLRST